MVPQPQHVKVVAIYTADGFIVDKAASDEAMHRQDELYDGLKAAPWKTLYELAFHAKSDLDASVQFLVTIAKDVVGNVSRDGDVDITKTATAPNDEALFELLRSMPYVLGCEFVSLLWMRSIYGKIADVFNGEFAAWKGTAEEYFKSKDSGLNVAGKVYFHLVEAKEENYPFAFLATYSEGRKNSVRHVPLKNALDKHRNQDELLGLLSSVSRAAEKSDFLSELIESGELFSPLRFTSQEAYTFLKETPVYEECGVICRIPDFWKKKYAARLQISVEAKKESHVGLQALMSFSPDIYLGDERFTKEEVETLLSETSGLAFLKGKWVELDKDKLRRLLEAFEKFKDRDVSLAEALRMQAGIAKTGFEGDGAEIEITNGEWLQNLKEQMTCPSKIKPKKLSSAFKAVLRNYQTVGFNWMDLMLRSGFGALLADDMGLGKTVQILALLETWRKDKVKTLLVIPASLIQNWKKEAEKFAPKLRLKILHGVEKEFDTENADLFVTTYGMIPRIKKLSDITWDVLILDEAQAIKNHESKQTRAVKTLKASSRIAMTGTPIENKLDDLWSIFDFLNKGLLGSAKEFEGFTKSLKDDATGYARLRGAVSPFILRRLKTDKSIICDLPDKIETVQFTTLAKKQVMLYGQLVGELKDAMDNKSLTAMARRALILASIIKFKQICNHPDHYLGSGDFAASHSGKFEALSDICRTIADKRERVLVFTQFREITEPLSDFLATVFEREGLVLHGGTSVKKRGELVERFNGDEYVPYMVLSLKAGGVGLNLTSANHVIHFDRWWNPAVENQATDRAFRIGQKRNVNVYKFVTTGTIEEKIDMVIAEKQKLAGEIITETSGEKWITEMGNDELFNLFKLEA